MNARVTTFAGLVVLLCLTTLLPAQNTWWVDAARGNDTNAGSWAKPFLSITKGISILSKGDTLYIMPGTYSVSKTGEVFPITVGNGAVPQDNVRIIAPYGPEQTILDAEGKGGVGSTSLYMIRFYPSAVGAQLIGLHLTNMDTFTTSFWDMAVRLGSYSGGLFMAKNVTVAGCKFSKVYRGMGIWYQDGGGHRIHHNLFLNNSGIAAFIHGNTAPPSAEPTTYFYNNTFVGSTHTALYMYPNVRNVTVVNNIAYKGAGIGFQGDYTVAGPVFHNNCVFGHAVGKGYVFTTSLSKSNWSIDPDFVDPTKDDYRLKPTSKLIGMGYMQDLSLFNTPDFYGGASLFDHNADGAARVDIGCHERADVGLKLTGTWGAGKTVTLDHTAPSGYLAIDFLSLERGGIALPTLGTFLLDPLALIPGAVFLTGGNAKLGLPLPNDPNLAGGITVYTQAIFFSPVPVFKPSNMVLGIF